jgi:hypothetical protein
MTLFSLNIPSSTLILPPSDHHAPYSSIISHIPHFSTPFTPDSPSAFPSQLHYYRVPHSFYVQMNRIINTHHTTTVYTATTTTYSFSQDNTVPSEHIAQLIQSQTRPMPSEVKTERKPGPISQLTTYVRNVATTLTGAPQHPIKYELHLILV